MIETATELFSEHGFHGTSTREIAEAAGVNEALIFRHFPTKEDLFWAVLADKLDAVGARWEIRDCFDAKRNEADAFAAVAAKLLDRTAQDAALTRLLLFAALHGELSNELFRTYMADYYEVLAQYIRRGVARGRFRQVDPLVAARAFLGMVVYHQVVQELLGGARYEQFTPDALGAELADLLLHGIAEPSRKRRDNGNRRQHKRTSEAVIAIALQDENDNGNLH